MDELASKRLRRYGQQEAFLVFCEEPRQPMSWFLSARLERPGSGYELPHGLLPACIRKMFGHSSSKW